MQVYFAITLGVIQTTGKYSFTSTQICFCNIMYSEGCTRGVRVQRQEPAGVSVCGEDEELVVDGKRGTPGDQLLVSNVEGASRLTQTNDPLLHEEGSIMCK